MHRRRTYAFGRAHATRFSVAHILPHMTLLDSWTRGEHTADGVTHPTYRKGSGPGVVVIHEIPGLTPEVIGFAEEVVAAGFTVVLPHLFGRPEAPKSRRNIAQALRQVCVSKEFTKLATGQTTPVAGWLRSLARELHAELGGPGVGALGMCFTGGFALAMMVDPAVAAPVAGAAVAPVRRRQQAGGRPQPLPRRPGRGQGAGRRRAARCSACATARTPPSAPASTPSPASSAAASSGSSSRAADTRR